jgi:mycothiol system anti-sigma-R factor
MADATDDHDHHVHGDCSEALEELYTYLDGELTEDRRELIAHHLNDCNPCFEAFDFEAELRIVISHRCRDEVPEALRTRIADQLAELAGQADPASDVSS